MDEHQRKYGDIGSMTPLTTLADATDIHTARIVLEALKKGGWIVVDKGAIGRAQAEAVRQYEEDHKPKAANDNNKDWQCPINYKDCTENCGNYGCGN